MPLEVVPGLTLIICLVDRQKLDPKDELSESCTSVDSNEAEGLELPEYTRKEGIQGLGEIGVLE